MTLWRFYTRRCCWNVANCMKYRNIEKSPVIGGSCRAAARSLVGCPVRPRPLELLPIPASGSHFFELYAPISIVCVTTRLISEYFVLMADVSWQRLTIDWIDFWQFRSAIIDRFESIWQIFAAMKRRVMEIAIQTDEKTVEKRRREHLGEILGYEDLIGGWMSQREAVA